MKPAIRSITQLYRLLMRFYPGYFRGEFSLEMEAVFSEALAEATKQGTRGLVGFCWRELRDWSVAVLSAYWRGISHYLREAGMDRNNDTPGILSSAGSQYYQQLGQFMMAHPRFRRLFDLGFVMPALILFAPLMLIIAILIKLDSPGAVFFCQQRVGKGGQTFKLIKFRSMIDKAEVQTSRVTRLGHVLRRFNLDELPQLMNILRGEMSLFGPYPKQPEV